MASDLRLKLMRHASARIMRAAGRAAYASGQRSSLNAQAQQQANDRFADLLQRTGAKA